MKIKDCSIIETKLIEDLFTVCNAVNNGDTDFKALRQAINRLKLKPLTPIVECAFDKGLERGYSGYPNTDNHTKLKKENYINNTIIE